MRGLLGWCSLGGGGQHPSDAQGLGRCGNFAFVSFSPHPPLLSFSLLSSLAAYSALAHHSDSLPVRRASSASACAPWAHCNALYHSHHPHHLYSFISFASSVSSIFIHVVRIIGIIYIHSYRSHHPYHLYSFASSELSTFIYTSTYSSVSSVSSASSALSASSVSSASSSFYFILHLLRNHQVAFWP